MSPTDSDLYVGLMSGTSADGIDAVLVDLSQQQARLIGHHSHELPAGSKERITQLALTSPNELDTLCNFDIELAEAFAAASLEVLKQCQVAPSQVRAIGSHGQTIRHQPPERQPNPFTLQIGDPNTIAELTGIDVVADFRRRDIAAGGHGAPLAPAFHQAAFASAQANRVVLNIGGMANISYLGANQKAPLGFDTGPGNVLMDAWIQQHKQESYDKSGNWAASGTSSPALLNTLMQHPFISELAPKSTGRETFNIRWVEELLQEQAELKPEEVQATLLEFTCQSISEHINPLGSDLEVYVCGGGAHNKQLMNRLAQLVKPSTVNTTDKLGIHPDWVEAVTFAWLARQTINGRSSSLPSVSGAKGARILGGIYQA